MMPAPTPYGALPEMPPKRLVAIEAMLDLNDVAQGPIKTIVGEWLVAQAKALDPWYAGLQLFSSTSERRRFTIASYHPPAQLCWSWALSIKLLPAAPYGWRHAFGYRSDRGWAIRCPYLFDLSWTTQPYSWMLSGNARNRLRCLVSMLARKAA